VKQTLSSHIMYSYILCGYKVVRTHIMYSDAICYSLDFCVFAISNIH